MLDIALFDERTLAYALAERDHDLMTADDLSRDWHEVEIDDVGTQRRSDDLWEIQVSYRSISTDETEAFPCGEIVASSSLSPGENDTYRHSMVVVFDELIEGHRVILEGDHGGSAVSDDSHSAYLNGTISVVPAGAGEDILRDAVLRQRRDLMSDIHMDIDRIAKRLQDATADEMRASGVLKSFGGLARLVARAA